MVLASSIRASKRSQTKAGEVGGVVLRGKEMEKENKKFLYGIQQQKMRELWNNEEDKIWKGV